MTVYSVYIHIPFCQQRCSYCDFNTYTGMAHLIPAYITALGQEAAWVREAANERLPVHTLYLGGGTPSLLPADEMGRLWEILQEHFELLPGLEASLEANPGTLNLAYLQALRRIGFNRLSLGMQSAQPEELALLGRQHDVQDVARAVGWGRAAGFDNLSLDLIFGLPGQTPASWEDTSRQALALNPEHLSLYALSIEAGTPIEGWVRRGTVAQPDPDLAADLYEQASDRLAAAGYLQYEISNWARAGGAVLSTPLSTAAPREGATGDHTGFACQHNLQYWRNLPYLGLGAGAHGYAAGVRTANSRLPKTYIQRMGTEANPGKRRFPASPAAETVTPVDREAEIGETMMMGLRLTQEGVSAADFQARFGEALATRFQAQIARLEGLGLLEWTGEHPARLRLSQRGRLLGNQVFVEFI